MDETDFDTGPLRGRFRADPDMRGAYGSADASNPLTAVTNMGTGVIRMTETDVFADGAALAAATDGRFVPLSDGRTLDTHGIDDGTALTSMHPLSVQGAWERCLNGSGSSADHETVMTEYRRASAAGEFERLGESDLSHVARETAEMRGEELRPYSALARAADATRASLDAPSGVRVDGGDRISAAAQHLGLTDWYGLCGHVWKCTQGSQCPECCGNTHLGLATSFGKVPVTPEMIADAMGASEVEPGYLTEDDCAVIYRAMDARRPVPLVSEAEDADWAVNFVRSKAFQAQKDRIAELESQAAATPAATQSYPPLTRGQMNHLTDLVVRQRKLIGQLKSERASALHDYTLARADVLKLAGERDEGMVRIMALTKERDAAQRNFDTLCRVNDSLRARLTTEQPTDIDYHGPTETVPHPDIADRTVQRAVPDPTHEQFHRSIGDVLAGKIIPAARRQMEDALGRAPKEPTSAPDAILRGNKAPVGIVERQT